MTTDEILSRAGLEPIAGDLTYPLLVRYGEECWFTAVRAGVRVRVCKVQAGELLRLIEQAAAILQSLRPAC